MSNELIIALISLIGGGVITFFITKYFRERKSLGYQIISKMSLVNVNPEVRDKIKIDYDGTSVENLLCLSGPLTRQCASAWSGDACALIRAWRVPRFGGGFIPRR